MTDGIPGVLGERNIAVQDDLEEAIWPLWTTTATRSWMMKKREMVEAIKAKGANRVEVRHVDSLGCYVAEAHFAHTETIEIPVVSNPCLPDVTVKGFSTVEGRGATKKQALFDLDLAVDVALRANVVGQPAEEAVDAIVDTGI